MLCVIRLTLMKQLVDPNRFFCDLVSNVGEYCFLGKNCEKAVYSKGFQIVVFLTTD